MLLPLPLPLPLPGGERPRLVEALLVVAVVVGLCSLGCATSSEGPSKGPTPRAVGSRTRRLPAPVLAASRQEVHGGGHRAPAPAPKEEGAAFVTRALRDGGLRFGTDGSTRALWGYLRAGHQTVAPTAARPGDVLFFDTRAGDAAPDCDEATDHAGLVEAVEPDGRIMFVEARGGQVRRSVVDPAHPMLRRNERGEIANTFLRPKQVTDPPDARYFAGQMLCGIGRPARPAR